MPAASPWKPTTICLVVNLRCVDQVLICAQPCPVNASTGAGACYAPSRAKWQSTLASGRCTDQKLQQSLLPIHRPAQEGGKRGSKPIKHHVCCWTSIWLQICAVHKCMHPDYVGVIQAPKLFSFMLNECVVTPLEHCVRVVGVDSS